MISPSIDEWLNDDPVGDERDVNDDLDVARDDRSSELELNRDRNDLLGPASSRPFSGIPQVDLEPQESPQTLPTQSASSIQDEIQPQSFENLFSNLPIEPKPELLSTINTTAHSQVPENLSAVLETPEPPQAPPNPQLETNVAEFSPPEMNLQNIANSLPVEPLDIANVDSLPVPVPIPSTNMALMPNFAGFPYDWEIINNFIDDREYSSGTLSLQPLSNEQILPELNLNEKPFSIVWHFAIDSNPENALGWEWNGEICEANPELNYFCHESNLIEQLLTILSINETHIKPDGLPELRVLFTSADEHSTENSWPTLSHTVDTSEDRLKCQLFSRELLKCE